MVRHTRAGAGIERDRYYGRSIGQALGRQGQRRSLDGAGPAGHRPADKPCCNF